MGCLVTWVTWVRGLRGLRGSDFYLGCLGYVSQNIFYVGHNFYVGCVGQIYFSMGQTFLSGSNLFCVGLCVGQNFLRGPKIFALINFYLLDEIILLYYN